MKKIKVAVLSGGESSERKISLISGNKVASFIPKEKYKITKYDTKKDLLKLIKDIKNKKIDVVFPVLHGKYGEDGTIQGLLELLHIPYVGCGVLTSSLCMNKIKTKQLLSSCNIKTPNFKIVTKKKKINLTKIKLPCVIKPIDAGSSVGISIPKTKRELKTGIKKAFKESETIMLEQFIKGKEYTISVIGSNDNPQVLPVTEIIANISKFYDYDSKYKPGGSTHICPAKLSSAKTKELQNIARDVYQIMGCRGMSRIDFMQDEKTKKFYFIEVNTIPGMTNTSLLPEAAKAGGISFAKLLDKLINWA